MHIVDAITKKERAATDAAYRRGFQAGMREGYTSRVKDEVAARWHGTIRAREFNDQEEGRND